jgi:hypothetical protein
VSLPPIAYFRKEDFPELKDEPWAQRLFSKLDSLARQTQQNLSGNLSVTNNFSGFWWDGTVGAYTIPADTAVIYPYTPRAPTLPTNKFATSIQAFPFTFKNQLLPVRVKAVIVAQAFDVTNKAKVPKPALLGGVAWDLEKDDIKIYAVEGMLLDRSYRTRLLVLGE